MEWNARECAPETEEDIRCLQSLSLSCCDRVNRTDDRMERRREGRGEGSVTKKNHPFKKGKQSVRGDTERNSSRDPSFHSLNKCVGGTED